MPGRTQTINFFDLGHRARLADLPGYGYAAVPQQDKIRWQQVMANYLVTRENLKDYDLAPADWPVLASL